MAEILPFRALHYNPKLVSGLDAVATQPYDKISPQMQARYYDLSPYNLVRIIRARQSPEDTPEDNVYSRAARHFRDWIEQRVLISEAEPALYPYYQEYALPGLDEGGPPTPGAGQHDGRKLRRGFTALCRVEDYSAGVVHRHEETLSAPKADRLELLKATRAHFGLIFMLYSDPEGTVEEALEREDKGKPWEEVEDEFGTLHSVWRVTEPGAIDRVVEAMRTKKLVIADGHHRYETALAYRDWCRAGGRTDHRAEYVMATFIRMETNGLTILPTHRVVHSLPGFDWTRFTAAAEPFFDLVREGLPDAGLDRSEFSSRNPGHSRQSGPSGLFREQLARFREQLAEAGRERPAIGAYAGPGKLALLLLRRGVDLGSLMPDLPASLARLDVVCLHRLILERALGIDRQAVESERNLRYVREWAACIEQVESGRAQVCFLMNPTPIEAVRENAFAGRVLPQKSTDFYPKLLSGLTIFWLDNPAGI
jgi:uncharacterized protein (DUF1015 family)